MIAQINPLYIKTRFWKLYSRMVSYLLFEGRPLTTRGQWINPIVFGVYKLARLFPSFKKVKEPIFVIGTGRSGTTILGIVMSMHKDVAFLNEPKALWHEAYAYEDLIGSYSNHDGKYYLSKEDADGDVKRKMHAIFSFYSSVTFSSRIVDKYPELIFRIPFVKAVFPDAKFLFLVRNGWDTCHSINQWSVRLGKNQNQETHDWWGRNNRKWRLFKEQVLRMDGYYQDIWPVLDAIDSHVDMAALEWIATMRQGMNAEKLHPDDVMTIKYEELVSEPEKLLKAVESFAHLDHDEVFVQYGKHVLKKVSMKPPFDLHPSIEPLFAETMERLGYSTQKAVS